MKPECMHCKDGRRVRAAAGRWACEIHGPIKLQVFTARVDLPDPDLLHVSWLGNKQHRSEATPFGHRNMGQLFAPSPGLFWPLVQQRRTGVEVTDEQWAQYVEDYRAEMRRSYRRQPAIWEALARMQRVVLACYCRSGERCHRHVLAEILVKVSGGSYGGELLTPNKQPPPPVQEELW